MRAWLAKRWRRIWGGPCRKCRYGHCVGKMPVVVSYRCHLKWPLVRDATLRFGRQGCRRWEPR